MDKVRLGWSLLSLFVLLASPSLARDFRPEGPTTHGDELATWRQFITAASKRFSIPERWIDAVILAESGGQATLNDTPITSRAGAMGLMQVMPETFREMRDRYALGADPYDPETNILAGSAYLAELDRQFGFPGLFAAYNAGPQCYEEHLSTGDPLPDETVSYLKTIDGIGLQLREITQMSPRNVASVPSSDAAKGSLFFVNDASKTSPIFVPLRSTYDLGR